MSGAGAGGREALQSRKVQVGTGIEQIILKLFSGDHLTPNKFWYLLVPTFLKLRHQMNREGRGKSEKDDKNSLVCLCFEFWPSGFPFFSR